MRITYKAQNLYTFLENIDRQQSLRLQDWTDKQKDLEEKHQECLHSMVAMFPKVGLLPHHLFSEQGQSGGCRVMGNEGSRESLWAGV